MTPSIRKELKSLALLVWILVGTGLLVSAAVTASTWPYAICFGIAFSIWGRLQLRDTLRTRQRIVQSVLQMPLEQLYEWGCTDDFIERLLSNSTLRGEYLAAVEQHAFRIEELLRADMSSQEFDERLKWAKAEIARQQGESQ
jgi:hypothetical protein